MYRSYNFCAIFNEDDPDKSCIPRYKNSIFFYHRFYYEGFLYRHSLNSALQIPELSCQDQSKIFFPF